MSIVLQGSTSGSVTLQEPAIAGTTVLDLPAVSGTVLTTGSSGQSIPKAALPTGSVLQVVQSVKTDASTTASTSLVTTGFSASITPTSSTSKILITVSGMEGSSQINLNRYTIYRGANNLSSNTYFVTTQHLGATGNTPQITTALNIVYLDSPATTSSTTYTLYFSSDDGSNTVSFNGRNGGSANAGIATMTLMEIAA